MLAIEANDEWLVGRAYISKKSMAEVLCPRASNNAAWCASKYVGRST
jgi:hypothetical protein